MTAARGWVHYDRVEGLEGLWRKAEGWAPASPFQSYGFARRWLECFPEAEAEIWAHSEPPMIVPLARREGRMGMIGEGLFDYLDPIGASEAGLQEEAAGLTLAASEGQARFTGVRGDSRFGQFWARVGGGRAFSAAPLRPASAGPVQHSRTPGRARRAAEAGMRVRQEGAGRGEVLEWILEQKSQRTDTVLGAREQHWIARLVREQPEVAEVWSLRRRDRLLSGMLCWRDGRCRYCYTIAYERAEAALSPGILLLYFVVTCTMNAGWDLDFLTGEQPYKLRFATAQRPLFRYGIE